MLFRSNVGAGFTPPSGSYLVAGADIGRGLQVDSARVTHVRFDNNGLNYFYGKNLGITALGHGFGLNVKLGSDASTEYNGAGFYALANGLYTSSATANAHIAFATTLQNNYSERMRITDTTVDVADNVEVISASIYGKSLATSYGMLMP